jgi:hypothetical protein
VLAAPLGTIEHDELALSDVDSGRSAVPLQSCSLYSFHCPEC